MITLKRFKRIEAVLRANGYADMICWSEGIVPPVDANAFAAEAIYVICNGGMAVAAGSAIAKRCLHALTSGQSCTTVFAHPGKGPAIDHIWAAREELFAGYQAAGSKLDYLQTLPFIGPVTRHHLAKNFGVDEAKPDVHMVRLARRDGVKVKTLCNRLARATGYRVATIDSILWRACADGVLNSRGYELQGWKAAFRPWVYDHDVELVPVEALTDREDPVPSM